MRLSLSLERARTGMVLGPIPGVVNSCEGTAMLARSQLH